MSNTKSDISCNICNKNYASRTSLYNHNKRFHQCISNSTTSQNKSKNNIKTVKNSSKKVKNTITNNSSNYNCRKCNKICNSKQSRWYHENHCNNIILYDNNKIEQLEKEINELKNIIITTTNNSIINNGTNNNTNNTNNGTINNTTNIIKVTFGAVCIYFAKQNIFMTTRFKIKINKFLF